MGPGHESAPGAAAPSERRFPCAACGAQLAFSPGTRRLACAHCGATNEIEPEPADLEELDFRAHLARLGDQADQVDRIESHCGKCGANVQFPDQVTSHDCPFCGSAVVATARSVKLIKPGAVLPFAVPAARALESYRAWIRKRWFAPSKLKSESRIERRVAGTYLPYWTYDARTSTDYVGQRGEHYWGTETYWTTVNGRRTMQTRRVRKTRWYPAAGRVDNAFNDLLVAASTSLPHDLLRQLTPWNLGELVPYADEYLAGFRAESYAVGLAEGFADAENQMQATIDATIRRDIGGDEQTISSKTMHHHQISFKHVLLPVWVCAYRYKDRLYQVLVNAQTGEVVGDRPYSVWKITLAALGALAFVAVVVVIALVARGG